MLSSVASSAGTNIRTRPAARVSTATSATKPTDANTAAIMGTTAIIAMNTACSPVTMPRAKMTTSTTRGRTTPRVTSDLRLLSTVTPSSADASGSHRVPTTPRCCAEVYARIVVIRVIDDVVGSDVEQGTLVPMTGVGIPVAIAAVRAMLWV